MAQRSTFLLFFFYFIHSACLAQNKLTIWLGKGMDTLFDHGILRRGDVNTDYTLFEFLGYTSYWHRSDSENNTTNYNRVGLILTAKTTKQFGIRAEAAFGKNDDTCFIFYRAGVDKITEGRSAALSIINLFSKPGNKIPQGPPVTYISSIHFKGKLQVKADSANFWYAKNKKGGYIPDGGLQWGADSAHLQRAITGMKNKGKLKKRKMGILLLTNETIIAAMDQFNSFNVIYIRKSVPEEEKLMAAAYFYMIACYR